MGTFTYGQSELTPRLGYCLLDQTKSSVCLSFNNLVGFENLWFCYLILLGVCLVLSVVYAAILCYKLSTHGIIKWHVGIFLVNATIWFWSFSLILGSICDVHLLCGYNLFSIILIIICVILCLLDLYFAPEAKYFRNQMEAEKVSSMLDRIKAAKPVIGLYIKGFHYENWGKHTFKKVTFRERRLFKIDGFLDVSQTPSRIDGNVVTLINFSKQVSPGDAFSQTAFNQFKNRYVAANQHRDTAMNTPLEVIIPEIESQHIMIYSGRPPWYASNIAFYILSILNISILLRIFMMAKSNVLSLLIHKKYFVDPNIQRTYDFETGLVGPTVVHNFVMSPQQGYGQTQHGYVPTPTEFGQTATAPPPTYEQHHNFPAL